MELSLLNSQEDVTAANKLMKGFREFPAGCWHASLLHGATSLLLRASGRLSPGVTNQAPRVHGGGRKAAGMHSHPIIPRVTVSSPCLLSGGDFLGSQHLLFCLL